jgi:hypothetical protein
MVAEVSVKFSGLKGKPGLPFRRSCIVRKGLENKKVSKGKMSEMIGHDVLLDGPAKPSMMISDAEEQAEAVAELT